MGLVFVVRLFLTELLFGKSSVIFQCRSAWQRSRKKNDIL